MGAVLFLLGALEGDVPNQQTPPQLNPDQPKRSAKIQGLRKTGRSGRNEEGKEMNKLDKITLYMMKIMMVHNAKDISLKMGSALYRTIKDEISFEGDYPSWRGYPIIDTMQDDDRVEIVCTLVDSANFVYCVIFILDDLEGMEI